MARSLLLLLASLFLSLTASNDAAPSSCSDHWSQKSIACEVEEANLKFAQLGILCDDRERFYHASSEINIDTELLQFGIAESILEEKIGELNQRTQYFGDCQRKIEELISEIGRLKTVYSDFEEDRLRKNVKLSALEEEVLFDLVMIDSASLFFD